MTELLRLGHREDVSKEIRICEVPLQDFDKDETSYQAFLEIHRSWASAGVTRWFSLLRADGDWPIFVLAAKEEGRPNGPWLGSIVGVWSSRPIDRFDDLLEMRSGLMGAARPKGGAWHLIAATVSPKAQGMDLGRRLVGAALDWIKQLSSDARAFTLSPADGLPGLVEQIQVFWEGSAAGASMSAMEPGFVSMVPYVIHSVCRGDGMPALPILRLHLGAGASLDRVLFHSRADEIRGGGVNFRFAYSLDASVRLARKEHYLRWCEARAQAIRDGDAHRIGNKDGLWWVVGFQDPMIWRELASLRSYDSLEGLRIV